MKVLVTGRAGSGKSSVAAELSRRGLTAYDTDDVPNLSSWQNIATGELVALSDNTYVDLAKYQWVWSAPVIKKLVNQHEVLFICGGADNDFSFEAEFDRHFVLCLPPTVQIERLRTRRNNDYGKDPRMFEQIVAKQKAHEQTGRELGATFLDASLPIVTVVDNLLAELKI